eukprot:33787-Eustigmatos_ZCMA.PRE.1
MVVRPMYTGAQQQSGVGCVRLTSYAKRRVPAGEWRSGTPHTQWASSGPPHAVTQTPHTTKQTDT